MMSQLRGEDQRKVLGSMVAEDIGVKAVKVGLGHRPALIGETKVALLAQNNVIQQCDAQNFGALTKSLR